MAKNRTFSKTITQAQGLGFDKVGDSHEGTFESVKQVTITDPTAPGGKRDADLIMLTPDEGDRFGVWANKILSDLIADVPVGSYVRITYTGDGERKGKNSPAKLFKIEIAE